jgi:5-oxoprolinase (ATP-hydrolysing) subunit A
VHGKVTARDGSEVALHVGTLCIHSDTPGSPQIAAQVAKTLREAGVQRRALK